MSQYQIPANPGCESLPKDNNDYQYGSIFGTEKYPRKFKREIPKGLDIPLQKNVPACVNCAFTFVNQYKSRMNDNNDVNLSWRYLHAKTGEYGRGRHLRTVAKWLQKSGQPQDIYCEDNPNLPQKEFMNVFIGTQGEYDAQRRKIGAYTFLTPILDEICPAVVREPLVITLGGDNDDWRKPFDQIVRQTKPPKWYHAIALWDYDIDEGWLGIYNWWNDDYRRIDINYPLTGALSFRDLPDNDNNNMLKLVKTKESDEQYFVVGENKYRIPDSETLHYHKGKLGIVEEVQIISKEEMDKFVQGEDVPSIKLMRWVTSGRDVINDVFERIV